MSNRFTPAYVKSLDTGALSKKTKEALTRLENCALCPRRCSVNRMKEETGICRTGRRAIVASMHAHFGEEPPLVGARGSGTIFFTHCNLRCDFCQNWDISHEGYGVAVSDGELADMMLTLQEMGCHNINLVTPSHVVPQILAAVENAAEKGLHLPLVYNSSGYDLVETLHLLEGVVDIYMPDFKFWNQTAAETTCDAPDYPAAARSALVEMHRQVGDLVIDAKGIAQRGLIVRHLVMPGDFANTREIMRFIATSISTGTYVNVMSQYRPAGDARKTEELSRPLSAADYRLAVAATREEGIARLAR